MSPSLIRSNSCRCSRISKDCTVDQTSWLSIKETTVAVAVAHYRSAFVERGESAQLSRPRARHVPSNRLSYSFLGYTQLLALIFHYLWKFELACRYEWCKYCIKQQNVTLQINLCLKVQKSVACQGMLCDKEKGEGPGGDCYLLKNITQ
jgi:hypothetical protein